MYLDFKLKILDRIYKIYDNFIAGLDLACRIHCSECCTRNVTMTTLEGYNLFHDVSAENKKKLFKKILSESCKDRFVPAMTINRLAQLCALGKENIPCEETDPSLGKCPFLEKDECPLYEKRPFGCRCFVSAYDCKARGYAEIDSFVLTVNNLFLQFIEHIDAEGYSGNLTDILLYIESKIESKKNNGVVNCDFPGLLSGKLVQNYPITVLQIPPEHRIKIKPLLEALKSIKVPAGNMEKKIL